MTADAVVVESSISAHRSMADSIKMQDNVLMYFEFLSSVGFVVLFMFLFVCWFYCTVFNLPVVYCKPNLILLLLLVLYDKHVRAKNATFRSMLSLHFHSLISDETCCAVFMPPLPAVDVGRHYVLQLSVQLSGRYLSGVHCQTVNAYFV